MDEAAAFARDGVVCVRQVLDAGEVAAAAAAIGAVRARPGPLAQVASGADDPGVFVEDFCRWREIPQLERLARDSRVPAVAAALLATGQVRFYHDHILVKEGGTAQRTPWHQDQPYYNVDGHGVSAWIAVDPVPAGGSLELVAGSHVVPWLMPRTFLNRQARWFPEGSLAELPDIDADPGAFDIRRFALQPGDAVFFDFLTVHGAPGFSYPGRRRILSLRYLAADARHAPRAWRTSPPFDQLAAGLPAGAAMDHPLFPVVWPGLPGAGEVAAGLRCPGLGDGNGDGDGAASCLLADLVGHEGDHERHGTAGRAEGPAGAGGHLPLATYLPGSRHVCAWQRPGRLRLRIASCCTGSSQPAAWSDAVRRSRSVRARHAATMAGDTSGVSRAAWS